MSYTYGLILELETCGLARLIGSVARTWDVILDTSLTKRPLLVALDLS